MKKSSSPNWAELHSSMLITSKSHAHSSQVPCLMLSPKQEQTNGGFRYINMNEERVHAIDDSMLMPDSCCIGSSQGWLIFLNQNASPFLLNPFIRGKIQLPCLYSLLGILKIEKDIELNEYSIRYNKPKNSMVSYSKHLRESVVYKAILTSNPCLGVNNLGVVVIYGSARKLAYCKFGYGHDDSWSEVDGRFWQYHDIVCYKNQLYALGNNAYVEAWDMNGPVPVKRTEIQLCTLPTRWMNVLDDCRYLYVYRLYLVENLGDLLLVVRCIGEYVNEDNVAVHEEDLLSDKDTHPLVCPYKTLLFHVYKMDFDEKRWIEVESLGDSALFLGGNHSISVSISQCSSSVSGYKKNSIYYTDDYWERMEEDYLYGGHDMGVFSLEDQRVEPICRSGSMKIQPPPCWISPSLG